MSARRERGIALILALFATMLMSALAVALVMTATLETRIASHFGHAQEGLYAAEAIAERVFDDLVAAPDWNRLLDGSAGSSFADGPPGGTRTLADGSSLDLTAAVNLANCAKTTTCSDGDMDAVTPDRPWGPNNPRWRLFGWGPVRGLLPGGSIDSSYYGIVLVGDDPAEDDNDPDIDGTGTNPGAGVIGLRGEAYGPGNTHRTVELTVTRTDSPAGVRVLSWREVR